MSSLEPWQKLVVAAGGAVAVGAVLYYLLREEGEGEGAGEAEEDASRSTGEISKDELIEVLTEMYGAQQGLKDKMKVVSAEIREKDLKLDDVYERLKNVHPEDPMEKHGLTMEKLDGLLEGYSQDVGVRDAVAKLMGQPDPRTAVGGRKDISVKVIMDIHVYMLEQLRKLMAEFQKLPNQSSYDMKTLSMASQAVLDARVSAKFDIQSEDIEAAIIQNQSALFQDKEFLSVHMQMRQAMDQWMPGAMG